MRIFVTGGTGFVGSHCVIPLLDAGHSVRLFVRSPEKAKKHFGGLGYQITDIVQGDITNRAQVLAAMAGCDAVLHCAAVVSIETGQAEQIRQTNLAATDNVIGGAVEAGVPNIVYVSSLAALYRPGIRHVDETAPLASPKDSYARSKVDCDAYVRTLQERGAPVHIVYPSGVIGPDDPGLSESNRALKQFVRSSIPLTTSGIQLVDVRDLGNSLKFLLEHPPEGSPVAARHIVAGHYVSWPVFHRMLESVTGRRLKGMKMPGLLLRLLGRLLDFVNLFTKREGQLLTAESTRYVTQAPVSDCSSFLRLSGIHFRPLEDTLADSLRWLVRVDKLGARDIGRLHSPVAE